MLGLLKLGPRSFKQFRSFQRYQPCFAFHSQEKPTLKQTYTKELAERNLEKFEIGAKVHGFVVQDVEKIDVFDLLAIKLIHSDTDAQYLHLARNDPNNVFCVGFRTPPTDSSGLPHILEHMTLCGSAKYPCRDPFFKMLRRSLATFMNAMTGFDYTMYPFSTGNYKDFKNLRSVYLDAVFAPNLRELDFYQEGWRLEHKNIDDKNSPIIFKGVVFNEMKGVFSENENLLQYKFFNKILPSNTYGVISGGDPLVIPRLKYTDLVNFHRTYYHPSNSRFYSYGSLPLEENLEYINEHYLSSVKRIDRTMSVVPLENRWDKPRYEHMVCRPNPLNPDPSRTGTIGVGYLCNDIRDIQECLDLAIVADLLLSGPKAPFYKSLIESKLGTTYGCLTGYHPHTRDVPFGVSLVGVKPESFQEVEKVCNETMYKVVEEGFSDQQIQAVMHNIELKLRHIPRNFGMQLLYGVNNRWNHDGDVMNTLKVNETLASFETQLKENPKYIQQLVQKYFVDNKHKLVVTMVPKDEYGAEVEQAEQMLLKEKLSNLTDEQISQIYLNGHILRAEQEKQDNVEILPCLEMQDVNTIPLSGDCKQATVSGVPVSAYKAGTNGVCYYRGIINTERMPKELKEVLPLFNSAVTQMGTKNYDYRTFSEMMSLKTDGLDFSMLVNTDLSDFLKHEEGILIFSRCLERNLSDMWSLWTELFNNVTLSDVKRFETIVKSNAASLVDGIADMGHSYAMLSAASLISPSYKLREMFSGLTYTKKMRSVAQQEDLSSTLADMRSIADFVLNKCYLRSAMNSSGNEDDLFKSIDQFYASLSGSVVNPHIITENQHTDDVNKSVHHVLPFTVNYASKAILTVPYNDPDYAPLRVVAPLLSSVYLHPHIREKGGAYGGGSSLSSNGVFFFYSYRDPNSIRTFDTFDGAYHFLKNYTLTDNDLHQAKIQVLRDYCTPIIPSGRGMEVFLSGLTDEMRINVIKNVKATTKDDLMRVAEKYLQPEKSNLRVSRTLIGPENPELLQRTAEKWHVEAE